MRYFETPPTVEAIARGLSTIPRWTARTILDRVGLRWSVLQHSLVCGAVASVRGDPVLLAYALLHDCEEILTGDIPRPYKTSEQVELGRAVRREILAGLGLPMPGGQTEEALKEIDDLVLEAERWTLLRPSEIVEEEPTAETGGLFTVQDLPDLAVTEEVWGLLDLDVRAGIELFTDYTTAALDDRRVKSLASRV